VLNDQSTLAHQQIGERLRRLYSPDESIRP
jgi:hypothetical protein